MTAQIQLTVDADSFSRFQTAWQTLQTARTVQLLTHQPVPGFSMPPHVRFSGLELLSAIGRACTRPEDLSAPAALFPLLKYVEALEPGAALALTDETELLDPHKKTVLSDEFGSGMALLVAERVLRTPQLLDVSTGVALGVVDTDAPRSRRPDYIGITTEASPRLLVLEAKGTQGSEAYSISQVEDGCEQLRALDVIGPLSGMPVLRVAVGLRLIRASQTGLASISVSDPERDELPMHRLRLPRLEWVPRIHYSRLAWLLGDGRVLADYPRRLRPLGGTVQEVHHISGIAYRGAMVELRGPGGRLLMFAGLRAEPLATQEASADVEPAASSNVALSPDGFVVWLSD